MPSGTITTFNWGFPLWIKLLHSLQSWFVHLENDSSFPGFGSVGFVPGYGFAGFVGGLGFVGGFGFGFTGCVPYGFYSPGFGWVPGFPGFGWVPGFSGFPGFGWVPGSPGFGWVPWFGGFVVCLVGAVLDDWVQ